MRKGHTKLTNIGKKGKETQNKIKKERICFSPFLVLYLFLFLISLVMCLFFVSLFCFYKLVKGIKDLGGSYPMQRPRLPRL